MGSMMADLGGMRQDPMDKSKQQMHKGIDIRCKHDAVLATENGGKVVAVNQNVNTAGGKSITVEYNREDGSKVQTTYMHLSAVMTLCPSGHSLSEEKLHVGLDR